ncbi:MAG TPA: zf-HC2 domain-containing protein [Puia sp.]|nr:zf-HC2 domain-containing protein [Puia sp.]
MRDCKKIHPLLSLYLDGPLAPSEAARVEAHLKGCADARRELEGLKRLREVMIALPEPKIPQDLHQKIMAKLQGHPLPLKARRPFWLFPAGAMAAAVVVVFLFIQNPDLMDFNHQSQRPLSAEQPITVAANKPVTPVAGNTQPPPKQADLYLQTNTFAPSQPSNTQSGSAKDMKTQPVPAVQSAMGPIAKERRAAKKSSRKVAMNEIAPQAAFLPSTGALAGAPSSQSTFGGTTTVGESLDLGKNKVAAGYSAANANLSPAEAPAAAPAAPSTTAVTSWSGSFNPASSETQELVTDAVTFQKYWQTFRSGQVPPTVDFTTQAVVVLMDQERPTAGYSIQITALEDKSDQLVIHYKVEGPASGSFNAQVLTRPWTLQIIPKPTKPVVFQKD